MSKSTESAALHIPRSFRNYNPKLAAQLKDSHPTFRFEEAMFGNLMPLFLCGESPHVVMAWMMNGDNWEDALTDLMAAHVLTQDNKIVGPNVNRLGLLVPIMDLRQDKSSQKPIPGKENQFAIVRSQASWSKSLAAMMKYVSGVDYLVQLDGHSHLATTHFQQVGIEVINLTTAFLMIEDIRNRGLLNDDLENVICGLDLGNLPLVKSVREQLDLDVAIIRKWRRSVNGGERSETEHEFVYGNVKGKRVILIDDMISSGGTLLRTVELLLKRGAREIIVCAAHPIFAGGDYYDSMQNLLKMNQVKIVMTTNTLPLERPMRGGDKTLPYTNVLGSNGLQERKQVEMLDINSFMGMVLQVMMASENTAEIREGLDGHLVSEKNPHLIFEEITGQSIKPAQITAVYNQGVFTDL